MRHLRKTFAIFLILFITSFTAKSHHTPGADISYQCLGGDTYKVEINIYQSCAGINYTFNPSAVSITSACGGSVSGNWIQTNVSSNAPNGGTGTVIPTFCSSQQGSSSCYSGSGGPGIVYYTYETTVQLAPACSSWTFGYDAICCRNTNLNLGTGSADSYVEATLTTNQCNSSPQFESLPAYGICAGQPSVLNLGATETDGDSLVYSFVPGFNSPGVNLTYTNSNPFTNPFAGFSSGNTYIDSTTGEVRLTPTVVGNYVYVVQVQEYRNGVLIGSIMRDFQLSVEICNNAQPYSDNSIQNLTGATQISDNSVEVCVGNTMSFDLYFSDANAQDSLQFVSNLQNILPGATYTISYPNAPTTYDTAVFTVNWTAVPLLANKYSVVVEATDNLCPIPGIHYTTFSVEITDGVYAGQDQTICQGLQSAELSASGGTEFGWSSVSGDPIVVGQNFSCDSCTNPIASPSQTSCYEVSSNLSGSCKLKDTVCVEVAPDFTMNLPSDTLVCAHDTVSIQSAITPPSNYAFQWSGGHIIGSSTVQQPRLSLIENASYFVEVSSPLGCKKRDTVAVFVKQFPQSIRATASQELICNVDTVVFGVEFIQLPSSLDPNGFNFSWLPAGSRGGFTGPTNIKNPTANVTLLTDSIYTLVVSDTAGVCFDTSSIQVSVVNKYDVKPKVEDLCISAPYTFFSANTPHDIVPRPGGGYWSGAGIVNDSLGLWDQSVSGLGQFWVYYEVIGDACANRDSSLITVYDINRIEIDTMACDNFYWEPTQTWYTSTQTDSSLLPSLNSCDTLYTLNLEILNSSFQSSQLSVCDSFVTPLGRVIKQAGVYTDTLQTVQGCDSVLQFTITSFDTLSASITQLQDTLLANAGADGYLWVDCTSGFTVLPNDTNRQFIASQNGEYAVIIEKGGCIDTSACVSVTGVYTSEEKYRLTKVYPNPTNDAVWIEKPVNENLEYQLLDASGRSLQMGVLSSSKQRIHMPKAAGIYLILITNEATKAQEWYRIAKE